MPEADHLITTLDLKKYFFVGSSFLGTSKGRAALQAVDGVSLTIRRGETLGLVGESGCGKSTLGRTLLMLEEPTAGQIDFDGIQISSLKSAEIAKLRRRMQMVFQDPLASLNPRKSVRQIIHLPLRLSGLYDKSSAADRLAKLLKLVGLAPEHAARYPHQLSGGERQRVGIARALAMEPDFVVADEPVASLDVSIQAQIINLLKDLQARLHLTLLFISHDLRLTSYVSHRIAVMYLGKIVEICPAEELFGRMAHPYTRTLISAVPSIGTEVRRERIIVTGEPPDPTNPPPGCRFHPRCPEEIRQECREAEPGLKEIAPGHLAACHLIGR